jgi:hypothetical protein
MTAKGIKAKTLHAICLVILVVNYAVVFRILGMLIQNFDKTKERFGSNVGIVSGQLEGVGDF